MPNWFYTDANGLKQGPINEQQMKTLAAKGIITRETVVENEQGKSAPAGRVKGLTFAETKQPEAEIYGVASPAPTPSAASMASWFYYEGSTKKGPVDSATLKILAQHGIIKPETPIETDSGQVSTAGKIKGLVFGVPQQTPATTVQVFAGRPSTAGDADEQILFEGSPDFFRNSIFNIVVLLGSLVVLLVIRVGMSVDAADEASKVVVTTLNYGLLGCLILGGVSVGIMYFNCINTHLTITNHKSILRHGILSKRTVELLHEHIRSIGMSQDIGSRLLGIGRIDISSAASGVAEISVPGMRDPERLKKLVQ